MKVPINFIHSEIPALLSRCQLGEFKIGASQSLKIYEQILQDSGESRTLSEIELLI